MNVNYTGNFTKESGQTDTRTNFEGLKRSYFSNQAIQPPIRKQSVNFDLPNGCLAFSRKDSVRVFNGIQAQANPQCRPTTTQSYINGNHRLLRHGGLKSPEPMSGVSKLEGYGKYVNVHPLNDESLNLESNVEKKSMADNRKSSNHLYMPMQPSEYGLTPNRLVECGIGSGNKRGFRIASPQPDLTFKKPNNKVQNKPSIDLSIFNSLTIDCPKDRLKYNEISLAETASSINSLTLITDKRQTEISQDMTFRNNSSTSSIKLHDFEVIKHLGKGKYGRVTMVRQKNIGFICAMKTIQKAVIRQNNMQNQLIREIKIQMSLKHQNICSLFGFFDDQENIYLLMEMCNDGQLMKILKEQKRLPQKTAKGYIRQLCQAVDYLHNQMNTIHRDIKPQNILLQDGMLKLCDFGWSVQQDGRLRQTFCGTPLYVSPEILKGEMYDEKIDIWSIGIMFYEMLVGRIPFRINREEDLTKIIKEEIKFPEHVELSDLAKDFLTDILQKDPEKRLDIEMILKHEFLRGV